MVWNLGLSETNESIIVLMQRPIKEKIELRDTQPIKGV